MKHLTYQEPLINSVSYVPVPSPGALSITYRTQAGPVTLNPPIAAGVPLVDWSMRSVSVLAMDAKLDLSCGILDYNRAADRL